MSEKAEAVGSRNSSPSPKSEFKGPAPKAQPEDVSDVAGGEDAMPLNPQNDHSVQFTPGHPANGDAKVEIGDGLTAPTFVGLGKEELMKYANDPFWVKLRWTLFILFWVLWVAMLAGAIIIIILAPKCSDKKLDAEPTYYQLYAKSFADDGKLESIATHADYLKNLGVKTVIISQVLKSEDGSGTRQVTDFKDVDPTFGTVENFKSMVAKFHELGMKVMLQFIPNHSGIKHEWFTEHPDYYVQKLADDVATSNWMDIKGRSAWSPDPSNSTIKYLHQFDDNEADFNFSNPALKKQMRDALNFWVTQEVDGFLLSDVSYLTEDMDALQNKSATKNQPQNVDVLKDIVPHGKNVLLDVDDVDAKSEMFKKYAELKKTIPIVTDLGMKIGPNDFGESVQRIVEDLNTIPHLVLRLSGPRMGRLQKRLRSNDKAHVVSLIAFMMKAHVIMYYGDEIGIPASESPGLEKSIEKMTWENMETNPNVKFFKELIKRNADVEHADDAEKFHFHSIGGIFAFTRPASAGTYVIVTNFGTGPATFELSHLNITSKRIKEEDILVTPNLENMKVFNADDGTVKLIAASGVILHVVAES